MPLKFTNKQFFTALVLILIPTLIFFANIKTSRAAPLGVDLATSINSAFASNSINPLTNQQIIDNGCKNITSELVQNTENKKIIMPSDVNAMIKKHKGVLTTNQAKVSPILTTFQNQITTATAPINYIVFNNFINDLYNSMVDVTNDVQDSNNTLYDVFEKTSDVSAEVIRPELDYFIGNQDFSIEYIYNSLDATQTDINNNLTKDSYTLAEAQVFYDDIKYLIDNEFLNMQDRSDEVIDDFDNGLGTIKDIFVNMDEECVFIINDVLSQEYPLTVPIIKQYVCDSLYLATASNVQYNSNNCLVYK